jgi:hypothetical protein
VYEGVGRGKVPVLSSVRDHVCGDVVFIHARISSSESGLNQELSSLAQTGTTKRLKRMNPTIRPLQALVLTFNCKTS